MIYYSRPTAIEAVQWTGKNYAPVRAFAAESIKCRWGAMLLLAGKDGAQGWVPVPVGHWIVRQPGDPSHYWPVDPDYFNAKYDLPSAKVPA